MGVDCLLWEGQKHSEGYGVIWDTTRNNYTGAHVATYEAQYGPVPEGYEVHHECGNKLCVNPHHLEVLTQKEHSQRHRPTVCKRGHELAGDNIRITKLGWHRCRTCERERMRERRKALKCR